MSIIFDKVSNVRLDPLLVSAKGGFNSKNHVLYSGVHSPTEAGELAHRIWLIIFILLRLDIISGLRGIVYQFLGKQKSCLFRNNSSIIAYYFYFVKGFFDFLFQL